MLSISPLMSIYILDHIEPQTLELSSPGFQTPTSATDTQITKIPPTVDRLSTCPGE
jgi:hypothetical protein